MKYIYALSNFLFFICLLNSYFYGNAQSTTTDVALRMGYYEFMINLRNEVRDYLETIEFQMKAIVQNLNNLGKYRLAQERQLQFQEVFDRLSLSFDTAFTNVDRMFVLKAAQLTDTISPISAKKQLVQTAMDDARAAINFLIRRSEIKRLNLIRRAIGAQNLQLEQKNSGNTIKRNFYRENYC